MSFQDNLSKIVIRHKELSEKLNESASLKSEDFIQYSKEYAELSPIIEKINDFYNAQKEIEDLKEMLAMPDTTPDIMEMANEELVALEKKLPEMERSIKIALLPKDKADEKNAILEIRAGTGGEEASLFGSCLLRMYQRYAERRRWKFEILSISETGMGGCKEVSASISGQGVFSRLKFESGVHRVQRVPETESSGRVHTSAATVAVLPEAEEVDIIIDEKDLRIDVFRSSGPGGQSVNTTDSAVRIVHIPTGIVVQQQDEKSQHKNKAKSLKILRAKLYEAERSAKDAERAAQRKSQVGSGDRSERIRTYNFPQGRVSDHRINLTLYKINEVMNEGDLDEFIDALIAEDEAIRLAESV
jgi:peptide chain release factor 1